MKRNRGSQKVRTSRTGNWPAGKLVLAAAIALTAVVPVVWSAEAPETEEAPVVISPEDQARLVEEYGFRIVTVRMAASNHMVDVRYWIVDADKAHEVFRDGIDLTLEHPESGAVLPVPRTAFIGPMSQTAEPPKKDRQYFVFFKNVGVVESGDTVILHLGDISVGPLVVR